MNKRKLLRLLLLAGAAVLLLAAYLIWSALSSRPKDAGETVLFQANDIIEIQSSYAGEEQVFTKEQLYTQVWNEAVVDDNTITVYVKRIRNKIEDDPKQPRYLKTVRGIGYMLNV